MRLTIAARHYPLEARFASECRGDHDGTAANDLVLAVQGQEPETLARFAFGVRLHVIEHVAQRANGNVSGRMTHNQRAPRKSPREQDAASPAVISVGSLDVAAASAARSASLLPTRCVSEAHRARRVREFVSRHRHDFPVEWLPG